MAPRSSRDSQRRRPPRWRWADLCLLLLLLALTGIHAAPDAEGDDGERGAAKVDEALYSRQLYVLGE